MNFRVGFGYDIHKLVKNRPLILGGVKIPYNKGLLAHSDGDVLLHAICDSLLGAAGLGDIGKHFPDTDRKYKNISSLVLLRKTWQLLRINKYRIINIDTTVVAEEPKILPYITRMKKNILVTVHPENINIKATTNEGIDDIGRKEAIAAYSVTLISKC